ncbi:hypothetical protein KJ575_00335 [Patescibacteria group bacterium]|nr:hypothetical protein [Patescibacteria group bacterium]
MKNIINKQKMSNGVKKTLFTVILAMFGVSVLAMPALAATSVSLSPASVNVKAGQRFNAVIAINPQGASNYTVKIELKYPADLLEVKSFNFGSNWMPLSQSGYDLIDNENGVLIKTAGYPGGISGAANFGTVSFLTKKSGSGTIAIGNSSLALDANNQNALSGASGNVFVTITAPKPNPSASPTPSTQPAVLSPTPAPLGEPTPTEQPSVSAPTPTPSTQTASTEQPPKQSLFLAAISGIITLGTGSIWVSFFMGILIILIIGGVIYYFIQRERRKNLR